MEAKRSRRTMSEEGRGPLDWRVIGAVGQIFEDRLDGLVSDVRYIPNAINRQALVVDLNAGIQAETGRFEIQWWEHHGYKYHYVEDDLEFRFGWERSASGLPEKHFHPPDAPGDHQPSCIRHEDPLLVTLAVIKCWLDAVRTGDPAVLNEQDDPP